jgi:predicted HicB family RNase H-like nuclease
VNSLKQFILSLHAALANEAEAEGVSLNQLVVAKLALHLLVR